MKPPPDDYRQILWLFFIMTGLGLFAYVLVIWLLWEVVL